MKSFNRINLIIITVICLSFLIVTVFNNEGFCDDSSNAVVSVLIGKAKVMAKGNKKWSFISQGYSASQGDRIKTGPDSRIEITLPDKSSIRLASNSEIFLNDTYFNSTTGGKKMSVKLMLGKLWSKVSNLVDAESKFEVETHNAVAGVRGTVFRVNANEDKSVVVKVYTGAVAVSNMPIYARKHKKGKRVQVAGPKQVSKQEWEEYITKAMQEVRISANGDMSKPQTFASNDDKDDWVKWNEELDSKKD